MVFKSSINSGGGGGGNGTVTQVNTGTGLTGGPITTTGTVAIANSTANSLSGYDNSGVYTTVSIGSGLALSSNILIASAPTNSLKRNICFSLDGNGSAIAAGGTWYLSNINYAGTITAWDIVADASGSIVIDVWKVNAAVPTVANTITASALPALSSAQSAFAGAISGWTTSIAANDVFAFKVNSASTVTKVSLTIQVTAT